jgi:hypothetical protein
VLGYKCEGQEKAEITNSQDSGSGQAEPQPLTKRRILSGSFLQDDYSLQDTVNVCACTHVWVLLYFCPAEWRIVLKKKKKKKKNKNFF